MDQIETYMILFGIIIAVGVLFSKSPVPTSLLLVIVGMILSFMPYFPPIYLQPNLVFEVFLPLLLYQISSFSSWKDVRKNIRPIALLSVGHVIFIMLLVAATVHFLLPQLGWPIAFVIGAVISPPDDVAIVSIAERIHMPSRIVTILEGEGMLNDATALVLLRFAVVAALTHQFSAVHAIGTFCAVVVCETLYGLFLGHLLGELRLRIQDPILHMIASILTPFLAFIPAERLGGSGVLATVITGFVIGHVYAVRFTPQFRLLSRSIWPTLAFTLQSLLFLLIGLDLRYIVERISTFHTADLILYSTVVTTVVIIGRFIWVYPAAYLPYLLFPSIRKKENAPTWQSLFVISWAGMRGSISLAAALAVPILPSVAGLADPRDLIIFLVFCLIIFTLIVQGLTLPSLLSILDVKKYERREKYNDHLLELKTRLKLVKAVLRWLKQFREEVQENKDLLAEVKLHIRDYRLLKTRIQINIANHGEYTEHDEELESRVETFILAQIMDVERMELLRLWREEKINYAVRNKLLDKMDHRSRYLVG